MSTNPNIRSFSENEPNAHDLTMLREIVATFQTRAEEVLAGKKDQGLMSLYRGNGNLDANQEPFLVDYFAKQGIKVRVKPGQEGNAYSYNIVQEVQKEAKE